MTAESKRYQELIVEATCENGSNLIRPPASRGLTFYSNCAGQQANLQTNKLQTTANVSCAAVLAPPSFFKETIEAQPWEQRIGNENPTEAAYRCVWGYSPPPGMLRCDLVDVGALANVEACQVSPQSLPLRRDGY